MVMAVTCTTSSHGGKGLPASEGQDSAQLHWGHGQVPAALMRPCCSVDTAPPVLHMPPGTTLNADPPRPSRASAAKHRQGHDRNWVQPLICA